MNRSSMRRDLNIVMYYRDYDSTSDGQKLLMVFPVADAKDDGVIHVVMNWTEELKRVAAKGSSVVNDKGLRTACSRYDRRRFT
jgi:hypothetical protein